jgi:hypothetical protein
LDEFRPSGRLGTCSAPLSRVKSREIVRGQPLDFAREIRIFVRFKPNVTNLRNMPNKASVQSEGLGKPFVTFA